MPGEPEWQRKDEEIEARLLRRIEDLERRLSLVEQLGTILQVGSKDIVNPNGTTCNVCPEATGALVSSGQGTTVIFPGEQRGGFIYNAQGGGLSAYGNGRASWVFFKAHRDDGPMH